MALKSIGIIIAICATLTIAIDREVRFPPEYEHNHEHGNVKHRTQIEPASDENVAFKGHHGFHKPHYPHSSEESEEWEYFGFPKPHFPHSSEESEEWEYFGFPKPHFPHSSEESGEGVHYGHPKPHYPHSSELLGEHHGLPNLYFRHSLGESNNYDLHNSHFPHSSKGSGEHRGLRKSHFPHDSQESGEHHNLPKPHFSHTFQEQKRGHKIHRPDWYNPHFPQHPDKLKENFEEMERRRPLFYPIYPYHPFYPHAHPTTNDEEFETIEALKGRNYQGSQSRSSFPLENDSSQENFEEQKNEGPFYHGPHNPHFPMNSDSSENSMEELFGPFHHGFPHPHFNPFHKEPTVPEDNDVLAPSRVQHPTINSDDFSTLYEAQSNEEEKFKIPNNIHDIIENFHHGHGKPHHHGDKPNEDEDEADEEGSGEEEIIPLSAETNVPLIQDNA